MGKTWNFEKTIHQFENIVVFFICVLINYLEWTFDLETPSRKSIFQGRYSLQKVLKTMTFLSNDLCCFWMFLHLFYVRHRPWDRGTCNQFWQTINSFACTRNFYKTRILWTSLNFSSSKFQKSCVSIRRNNAINWVYLLS